jgi:hypothetical protein
MPRNGVDLRLIVAPSRSAQNWAVLVGIAPAVVVFWASSTLLVKAGLVKAGLVKAGLVKAGLVKAGSQNPAPGCLRLPGLQAHNRPCNNSGHGNPNEPGRPFPASRRDQIGARMDRQSRPLTVRYPERGNGLSHVRALPCWQRIGGRSDGYRPGSRLANAFGSIRERARSTAAARNTRRFALASP